MHPYLVAFIICLVISGLVACYCLIESKKRFNQEKRKQAKEFEQLNKLAGELAHEIKNPLSTIKVNLQLISEQLDESAFRGQGHGGEDLNQRVKRKIKLIETEANRLEQILDDFLGYARRQKLELADEDLNILVSDLVDFYLPRAYSQNIELQQRLCKEPLVCAVDANMIKQMLLNLFLNAQQALPEGGKLVVSTARKGSKALITVSDTGCGIPANEIEYIFEPYYSGRADGRGLGLATVKRIVEQHQGKIEVESREGEGTTFEIEIPLKSG